MREQIYNGSGNEFSIWDDWFESITTSLKEDSDTPSTKTIKKAFRIIGFTITDEEATYITEHWNDDSNSIRD